MTGEQKLEHARLYVNDLDEAYSFYTETLGLSEIGREEGVVYLGCGYDERFDLAIEEGGTGIDHFAVRADDAAEIDAAERNLADAGVETVRSAGDEPRVTDCLRFDLPSGTGVEVVNVERQGYKHPTNGPQPARPGVTPLDIDHVNLMNTDIRADIELLVDQLPSFRLSEVVQTGDGEWQLGFGRYGASHHDVGGSLTDDEAYSLHHVAFQTVDIAHMKTLIDAVTATSVSLEAGITRHGGGSNIAAYFRAPGGNRIEIDTEMAMVDDATEPIFHDGREAAFSAWGGAPYPETWFDGS